MADALDEVSRLVAESRNQPVAMPITHPAIRDEAEMIALIDIAWTLRDIRYSLRRLTKQDPE